MKINSINNYNKPKINQGFKAREFASVKTILKDSVQTLKIYDVNEEDTKFLDLMSQKINLKNLIDTNATINQLRQWKNIINNAIMLTNFNEPQRSFLMTKNNHPCALLTFKDIPAETYIDYLAAWPVAKGENVKLAGTSMLKTLFEHAQKNNTRKISLSMASDSPVNLKEYYKKMNFIEKTSSNIFEPDMVAGRESFVEKAKELDEIIKVDFIENPQIINLKKTVDINYR